MSDLALDQKAKLLELKKERDLKQQTPAEQIIESGAIPDAKVTPATTEAVPEVVVPVVDKKKEEASSTNPTPDEPSEELEFKWDAELEQAPATQTSQVDFKKIGSALNLEANNEDELVKTVGERLSKLKTLEEQSSKVFEGVPDSLKETIEIAKKGGDWQSFIGNSMLDPNQLDPVELFEREFERVNAYRFKKPDGTIDYDALDTEMDSMSDGYKAMQGQVIKQQLVGQQSQRKQAIVAESARLQEKFTKELSDAARELPEVFSKEDWGVKIEPKHVSSVVDGIMSGKLIKKHLGDIDPVTLAKLDAKKLTKLILIGEAGKNLVEHSRKQGIVQGKRELLDKTQNPQIFASGTPAAPETPDDKKPLTAAEKLKKVFSNQNSL